MESTIGRSDVKEFFINMSKVTNQYKKFMKDLEENIENKEDYEYIKGQMSNLFMMFFNELYTFLLYRRNRPESCPQMISLRN